MDATRNPVLALFAALFLISTASTTTAQERIVIAFDDDCTTCGTSIGIGQQATARIRAVRGGFSGQFGLTGAEFRVAGLPGGWTVDCVPNPVAQGVIGDPFEEGASIHFIDALDGSCLELFTCTITATTNDAATLEVIAHSVPFCLGQTCPCIVCDCSPFTTAFCAVGGQAFINGPSCTVSVEQTTWSQVKMLFD